MIEVVLSNPVFIAIAVCVVLIGSGLVTAYLIRINFRIRHLIRDSRTDDDADLPFWTKSRTISYFLMALSITNVVIVVVLTQYVAQIVVLVILQFVYVYGLEYILAKALIATQRNSAKHTRQDKPIDVVSRTHERFVPKLLAPLFNKQYAHEVAAGSSITFSPIMMFIDLFSSVPVENLNNKEKFYTIFSELVELAGSVAAEYNLLYTRCTSKGIIMLFDTNGADAIETFLKIKLQIIRRPHLLPVGTDNIGDTLVNGVIYSGDINMVMVNDGNFHQAVLSSESTETVISLSSIARELRIPLLMSETVAKDINTSKFQTRYMGLIRSHDSKWLIPTHDVINAYGTKHIPALIENCDAFETARKLQEAGNVQKAFSMFSQIIFQDPHDYAANYFREQCRKVLSSSSR